MSRYLGDPPYGLWSIWHPVQPIHCIGGCPYPAHLLIDVLAKVSYVKNATSVVQTRMNQVFPEVFEHG